MAPLLQVETSNLMPSSFLAFYDMKSIVGDIYGEYGCSWEKSNGTLYAGSKGVYFLGSFFLFERKLILEWEKVRLVQKADQGIEVVCKDESIHSFYGTQSPDRFWALLLSLHNDALLDLKRRRGSTYRRRNSDPWSSPQHVHNLMSESHDDLLIQPTEDLDQVAVRAKNSVETTSTLVKVRGSEEIENFVGRTQIDPVSCKMDQISGQLYAGERGLVFMGKRFFWETKSVSIRWEDIARVKIIENPTEDSSVGRLDTIVIHDKDGKVVSFSSIATARAVWTSLIALHNETLRKSSIPRQRHRRMNSDPLRESNAMMVIDSNDIDDSIETSKHVETMEEKWERAKNDGQLKTIVVENHVLNCDLDRFFSVFLQDEAQYSLARFIEERGDSSLSASRWKNVDEIESSRIITYTHPLNVPLAPPQADASKEQKCKRYGSYGLILETKTLVKDVPMADCFYVTDRIVVKSDSNEKVKLRMEFEITFITSTMFKGIITKTTTSELTSYMNDFVAYTSRALGDAAPAVEEVTMIHQKPESIHGVDSNKILTVFFVAIFTLQVWILYDIRSIKTTLKSLQR